MIVDLTRTRGLKEETNQASAPESRSSGPHFLQRHAEALLTAACALLTMFGWAVERWGPGLAPWVFGLAYLAGGLLPARDAIQLLVRERELDVDLLMVLAALGAGSIGHWLEGAVLIFIFSLSGTLETYAMARTRREITALMSLRPAEAHVIRGGQEVRVPAAELAIGEVVVIRPGGRIPADGTVLQGESAVDQSAITGESVPVEKAPGDQLFAGTINGHGALEMRVDSHPEETVLSRIIRMVEEARSEKPPTQVWIERFERLYSRAVVAGTVLVAAVPMLLGSPFQPAFYRAMVFMVAASPCALTMAIMPALLSGIANAARQGVLMKGAIHLENLGGIKCVALDKTGTLTRGEPQVTDVIPLAAGRTGDEMLRIAAALESRSEHPLAAAITRAAWDMDLEEPSDVQALVGQGVRGTVGGERWQIGKPSLFGGPERLDPHTAATLRRLEAEGKTVVLLGQAEPMAIIALRDQLRPGARAAIAALRRQGVRTVMLTGDNPATAAALAAEAGVDEWYAGLLPEEKVERVRALTRQWGQVAMVGDGVNDAPALALATVGVAMGRKGTDVAMETADVVLMGDDLNKIGYAIRLGRRALQIVKQNLAFATGMILLLILTTFMAELKLPLGVVGHEGSTLLVVLNGLRMLAPQRS